MKKSKLSITLVSGFIAAMALSACSGSIKSSKENVVSFTPYGSSESIGLVTDDVYNKYWNTSAGVSKFYDKVLEVLTRYKFDQGKWTDGEKNYQEIKNWAKNQVEDQKKQAKKNASNNGTSYDTEWKAILKSNNVENYKEFEQKFVYEEEKRVLEEWYRSNNDNAEELKSEFRKANPENTLNIRECLKLHPDMPPLTSYYDKQIGIAHYFMLDIDKPGDNSTKEKDKKSMRNLLDILSKEDGIKVYRLEK